MIQTMFFSLLCFLLYSCAHCYAQKHYIDESFKIQLPPEIKAVIINIGCNMDPPMPPSNESIAVIAVEPVLGTANMIVKHPRLFVITCAIADYPRFQTLHLYNIGGKSSSLSELTDKRVWYKKFTNVNPYLKKRDEEYKAARKLFQPVMQIVPVMPLQMLLQAIPLHVEILLLITDMQGYDFVAIQSAGTSLRRVPYLRTEVNLGNNNAYVNVTNDLDRHWQPHMKEMGYRMVKLKTNGGEGDAFWVLGDHSNVTNWY